MIRNQISLRGVAVNNLQKVDLDLPLRQLIAFCGVSGSGKTSLALDTLYAEGQRRYIESFSAYTRQFLEQLDKPAADSIEGIPPSIAVTRKNDSRSSRATVGSATQVNEHLQLLYARLGEVVCHGCGQKIVQDSAESATDKLLHVHQGNGPEGIRAMVGFTSHRGQQRNSQIWVADLMALGYRRVVLRGQIRELNLGLAAEMDELNALQVILDRITLSSESSLRIRDSLETALQAGRGTLLVWIRGEDAPADFRASAEVCSLDGQDWCAKRYSQHFRCEFCNLEYPAPEPQLFNFNNPLGACPVCEGFGNVLEIDIQRVIPDPNRSIRDGAIAPWNTPAYAHELEELLALAGDYQLPVDVPFRELTDEQVRLIREGVPERKFGGLNGFFNWLERRKYKMHLRVFLSRWRSYYPCAECQGARLNPSALAVRLGDLNIAEISHRKISDALAWFANLQLSDWQHQVGQLLIDQVVHRLQYLDRVGLGYLSLDRPMRTLSAGESHRVALTSVLGSNLVGMLYVLDEPCAGLHPADVPRLVDAVHNLRDRGNTVAVVEHEIDLLRASDHIVELGPGAGEFGGKVVFQGTPQQIVESEQSRTGDWLARRDDITPASEPRPCEHGTIRVEGARGNNLKNVSVDFPLGVMCVVTGVSGAGKSTLVEQTLYPAVAQRLRIEAGAPQPFDEVLGVHQIEDAVLIDPSPIGRTPRSNPVTYVKAFDAIRSLFAETNEAQARGFKPKHFSFNVEGGRCEACQGDGYLQVDMRLMADVFMKCPECHGQRFRDEVLEVKYRGFNIAEVLELSVREAFAFFRGHRKILSRLKCLIDVGLDYLRLGQPANTLSGGEAQRLKMATFISSEKRGRTLFVLDEPSTGLHFSDVLQLLDCFETLVELGHTLIVVDHHFLIMQAADWIVELGPGAADAGGQIVAEGTPDQLRANPNSLTGKYLRGAPLTGNNHA